MFKNLFNKFLSPEKTLEQRLKELKDKVDGPYEVSLNIKEDFIEIKYLGREAKIWTNPEARDSELVKSVLLQLLRYLNDLKIAMLINTKGYEELDEVERQKLNFDVDKACDKLERLLNEL